MFHKMGAMSYENNFFYTMTQNNKKSVKISEFVF